MSESVKLSPSRAKFVEQVKLLDPEDTDFSKKVVELEQRHTLREKAIRELAGKASMACDEVLNSLQPLGQSGDYSKIMYHVGALNRAIALAIQKHIVENF